MGLASQGSKYSDEDRRRAMGAFLVFGNYTRTAAHVGISHRTIGDWAKTEWWMTEIAKVRLEKADELDQQLSNSISKARKSVDDRLDTGDAYIKKDGEIGYKPVSCRDSATVFGIMYDKLALMRNMPTKITVNLNLDALQDKFEALAMRKGITIEGKAESDG